MSSEVDYPSLRTQRLWRLEAHLAKWPLWALTFGLLLAAIAKAGITFRPLQADPIETFPMPRDTWAQLSYGIRIIHWAVQSESGVVPAIASAVIFGLAIGVVIASTRQFQTSDASRILLIALILGPTFTVFLSNLGRPDVFTLTGGLVLGLLGRSIVWGILGAALMIAGNPEQAVVGTALLFGLALLPPMAPWRRSAAIALSMSCLSFVVLAAYARSVGVGTRVQYLPELIGNSLYGFTANLSLGIYAGYSVLWLVLAIFAWRLGTGKLLWLFLLMVIIPFLITALTLDQTRVFVGITTAGISAVLMQTAPCVEEVLRRVGRQLVLVPALAIALFLPAFEVSSEHVVRPPLAWLYSSLMSAISQAAEVLPED